MSSPPSRSDRGHAAAGSDTDAKATLARLERLAYVMDAAIPVPGTQLRIGLDPILGLLPGIGDGIAALLSAHILAEGARLGVPRATLLRMAGNVTIEVLIGTIPVLGDVFDAAWRANQRNVGLLAAHLERPRRSRVVDRGIVYGGLALFGLLLLGSVAGGVAAIAWIVRALGGAA